MTKPLEITPDVQQAIERLTDKQEPEERIARLMCGCIPDHMVIAETKCRQGDRVLFFVAAQFGVVKRVVIKAPSGDLDLHIGSTIVHVGERLEVRIEAPVP